MNPQIYNEFTNSLQNRLHNGVHTTEDSVRHTFFAAILANTQLHPENIILEFPHNQIPNAKLDVVIPNYDGCCVLMEFKYDRQIPGGLNQNRTQRAGYLFKDISRLKVYQHNERNLRLFVYLTDAEMAQYLANPQNGLTEFFELGMGQEFQVDPQLLQAMPQAFQGAAGRLYNASLRCEYSAQLPNEHYLRVYRVT